MIAVKVWIIKGLVSRIHDDGLVDRRRGTGRTVYLACPAFPAREEAEAALLNNWSTPTHPHLAEVRAVGPLMVGGVQVAVVERETDGTDA